MMAILSAFNFTEYTATVLKEFSSSELLEVIAYELIGKKNLSVLFLELLYKTDTQNISCTLMLTFNEQAQSISSKHRFNEAYYTDSNVAISTNCTSANDLDLALIAFLTLLVNNIESVCKKRAVFIKESIVPDKAYANIDFLSQDNANPGDPHELIDYFMINEKTALSNPNAAEYILIVQNTLHKEKVFKVKWKLSKDFNPDLTKQKIPVSLSQMREENTSHSSTLH